MRHDTYVFLAALVLAIGLVGLGGRRGAPGAGTGAGQGPGGAAPDTAAARRLALAEARRRRWTQVGGIATGLAVVGVLVFGIVLQPGPPPKALAATVAPDAQGGIDITLASVNDGRIHFFEVADPQAPGAKLRFFAIQKPDGHVQACMDACEICGDLGYYQDAGGLNCRNCGAPINLPTLGQTGGCNPIPVQSKVEGDRLVVDAASIYDKRLLAKGRR